MKLHAEVSERKHEIEIKREAESVKAVIDGRGYELEVSEPEPGIYLIKHGGSIFEAVVSEPTSGDGPIQVKVRGSEFEVNLFDPKRLRGVGGSDTHTDGLSEIKTSMPGKVVRILAGSGSQVEKGQAVVVVEAMKMQNELRSPKSGMVKDIRVSEGDAVGAGEVLATVE